MTIRARRPPHKLRKLLVIDDSTAVIGSISLSMLALEFRRELAIVTRGAASLRALDEFWRSLPDPLTGGPSDALSSDSPLLA